MPPPTGIINSSHFVVKSISPERAATSPEWLHANKGPRKASYSSWTATVVTCQCMPVLVVQLGALATPSATARSGKNIQQTQRGLPDVNQSELQNAKAAAATSSSSQYHNPSRSKLEH
eukprot:1644622-Pleurochrysis_carterae.AAC.3